MRLEGRFLRSHKGEYSHVARDYYEKRDDDYQNGIDAEQGH